MEGITVLGTHIKSRNEMIIIGKRSRVHNLSATASDSAQLLVAAQCVIVHRAERKKHMRYKNTIITVTYRTDDCVCTVP